jgi:predicted Zn finger-like uncharacterized protein
VFTQCSKCETVFRLSAESLRAAGGQVRCGRCGEVFNALSRLAEDSTGFTKGESSLELETRADEILESVLNQLEELEATQPAEAVVDEDLPPGVEVVQLQFIDPIDDELTEENSLEFTLPPGELDRIFIETRPTPLHKLGADEMPAERSERSPVELRIVPTHPSIVSTQAATLAAPTEPPPHPEDAAISASNTARNAVVPLTRIAGLEVAEDIRQELLASYNHPYADSVRIERPVRRVPFAVWLIAAVLLSLLLLFQLIRGNHEWIATHAPMLLTGYATTPNANLSSYQLRQWGVTGDPEAKGTLRVRASIMNTAAQLQRYPLLRVSLVNRFGSRVGAREFEPSEYLGKTTARMLAPGERVDATLDILDPGKDAEGFEIDVCIRRIDKSIACAGDAAQQTK